MGCTDTTEALKAAVDAEAFAIERMKEAEGQVKEAGRLRRVAAIAHARANPHPLAGRNVKLATIKRGGFDYFSARRGPNSEMTIRGVVTLADRDDREWENYRNHQPRAGEWFVRSGSGATAYRLTGDWELNGDV